MVIVAFGAGGLPDGSWIMVFYEVLKHPIFGEAAGFPERFLGDFETGGVPGRPISAPDGVSAG